MRYGLLSSGVKIILLPKSHRKAISTTSVRDNSKNAMQPNTCIRLHPKPWLEYRKGTPFGRRDIIINSPGEFYKRKSGYTKVQPLSSPTTLEYRKGTPFGRRDIMINSPVEFLLKKKRSYKSTTAWLPQLELFIPHF